MTPSDTRTGAQPKAAMTHPYRAQPARAFWNSTVAGKHPLDVGDWYEKRFSIDGARIATAGSCFAQHIGRGLRGRGFRYMDLEPAPEGLAQPLRQTYGYGLYSARYGNIYTARQLLQVLQRALGQFVPQRSYWEKDGGVVDPFRPTLEPEPFGSVAELEALRADHLDRVVRLFRNAEVFVFTLGLTEQWLSSVDGAAYPLCPGTAAGGRFDPSEHAFHNLTTAEVRADMEAFIALARQINPTLKLILTVSPVPLMATATGQQVAVATAHSKAVLRAVAGELYQAHEFVDYFPSFEILTSPFMKGFFFEADQREVSPHGVKHVMSVFFDQHTPAKGATEWVPPVEAQGPQAASDPPLRPRMAPSAEEAAEQAQCDEELLKAFGPDPE